MARVVLVTSVELAEEELDGIVGSDDEVFVVVPAVHQSRLQWLANDEDAARAEAEATAKAVADHAPSNMTEAEETREGPVQAVVDAVRAHRPDRVVVVVRTDDEASWLEKGALDRLPGSVEGVPVDRLAIE